MTERPRDRLQPALSAQSPREAALLSLVEGFYSERMQRLRVLQERITALVTLSTTISLGMATLLGATIGKRDTRYSIAAIVIDVFWILIIVLSLSTLRDKQDVDLKSTDNFEKFALDVYRHVEERNSKSRRKLNYTITLLQLMLMLSTFTLAFLTYCEYSK